MKGLSLLVAAVAGFSTAFAQQTTATTTKLTATATKSSSATEAATHTVRVGLQHDFQPDVIRANVGDVIHFDFYPKNHSVVKAEFKNPCIPYDYVVPGGDTFFSGYKGSEQGDEPPSWELTVESTAPTFFYCSAPGSCIDWSMVGVINPNSSQSIDIQKEYVKLATFQLGPGEPFPDEASPTPTQSTDPSNTPTNTPTPTDQPASDGGSGPVLSTGAIAGIAIGGAAVVIIAIVLIYVCGRKGGFEKGYRRSTVVPATPAPMVEATYPDNRFDPSKSPGPPGSPYGAQTETWRSSTTPSHFSPHIGSAHTSYMGGYQQNGQPGYEFVPQNTGHSAELSAPYDPPYSPQHPPAELPANPHPSDPSYGSHR